MNTKTKTFLGAALMALVATAVNAYAPESERERLLVGGSTLVGLLLGWLGVKQPGQGK